MFLRIALESDYIDIKFSLIPRNNLGPLKLCQESTGRKISHVVVPNLQFTCTVILCKLSNIRISPDTDLCDNVLFFFFSVETLYTV